MVLLPRCAAGTMLGFLWLLLLGCGASALPNPREAVQAYARAAQAGDADALHEMLTERSQRALGKDGVHQAVEDARMELGEQGQRLADPSVRVEQTARVRYGDGEEVVLVFENGAFRISSADALPAGAKTPGQALEQLRRVLARRSYAGLMRVLSRETRDAIERDLRGLVEALERPEGLEVKVQGDTALVPLSGGHRVRLRREGGRWAVEDFD
ncbi:MAG: hypothetical protein RMJ98_09900 [Myxococcales bacterium]|nr:hypothetical protein [Polyangiaceae bacterium]MDW8249602.1 hypothetical protein [Myxococcales bacterium]